MTRWQRHRLRRGQFSVPCYSDMPWYTHHIQYVGTRQGGIEHQNLATGASAISEILTGHPPAPVSKVIQ